MGKLHRFLNVHFSLSFRLIFWVGLILAVSISAWAYFNIGHQKQRAVENIVEGADRLGNTIRLGVHYAMMINSRDDITQIIRNIGKQEGIQKIRIYNRSGKISYSTKAGEMDHVTNLKDEPCYICHKTDPPAVKASLAERTRIFDSPEGERLLRVISPIYNEPGCAGGACHFHPEKTKVLGALDVVVSLKNTDKEIFSYERGIILMAVFIFFTDVRLYGFLSAEICKPPHSKIDRRDTAHRSWGI